MSNVFFKPWIGSKYGKTDSVFRHRILILGDSHYIEDLGDFDGGKPCDFTTGVMLDYLDPNQNGRWKSTFTKFMNSFVLESKHTDISRVDLWDSVAFYNYLQIPAGSVSRQTQHFNYKTDRDLDAFLEVIHELEPDIVISWGNNVWDAIPENLGYGKFSLSESFSSCCLVYPFRQRELKLIGIPHPSTSYKSSHWASVFNVLGVNV